MAKAAHPKSHRFTFRLEHPLADAYLRDLARRGRTPSEDCAILCAGASSTLRSNSSTARWRPQRDRAAAGRVALVALHPVRENHRRRRPDGAGQVAVHRPARFAATTGHGVNTTPGGVIMLSAEDDAEDTIRPRLEAAGADLDRV